MKTNNKHENYIRKVKLVNPGIEIVTEYLGAVKPITYICPICKKETTIKTSSSLYKNEIYGCRGCFMRKIAQERTEVARLKMIDKIDGFTELEIIGNCSTVKDRRICFYLGCGVCGHNFEVLGTNLGKSKWRGCPKCWSNSKECEKARKKGRDKTHKRMRLETKTKLDVWLIEEDIKLLDRNKNRIELSCLKCGSVWNTGITHALRGFGGCSVCLGTKYNTVTYKEKLVKLGRNDLEVISRYYGKRHNKKMRFLCTQEGCGHIWESDGGSVMKGTGCPLCSTSKGNRVLANTLNSLGISYELEKVFQDCRNTNVLPFDIFIESHNLLIEYDGIQHFEPIEFFGGKEHYEYRIKNDQIKNDYCKEEGIKLLRIPYWEKKNIGKILFEELGGDNNGRNNK